MLNYVGSCHWQHKWWQVDKRKRRGSSSSWWISMQIGRYPRMVVKLVSWFTAPIRKTGQSASSNEICAPLQRQSEVANWWNKCTSSFIPSNFSWIHFYRSLARPSNKCKVAQHPQSFVSKFMAKFRVGRSWFTGPYLSFDTNRKNGGKQSIKYNQPSTQRPSEAIFNEMASLIAFVYC